MTLRHPGTTDEHVAYKIKTTQPRRYLVRPNQGVIAPGGSETIIIILVDEDRQVLLQSYDRLGQSALDHSKEKFLVQWSAVSQDFSKQVRSTDNAKQRSDALKSMWNAVSSGGNVNILEKKLWVRHVVQDASGSTSKAMMPALHDTATTIENMTLEQMSQEVITLRRKYDEMVAFSVNCMAERDILNNTLEQIRRDLKNKMSSRASLKNSKGVKLWCSVGNLLERWRCKRNNNSSKSSGDQIERQRRQLGKGASPVCEKRNRTR